MNPDPTPPAPGEGSDPRLLEELRRRVQVRGPIPFAEFMALALYHPEGGYYARTGDPVGRGRGRDYYTAPTRHPAFGEMLGRQVLECLARVGGTPLELVEFGPGSGDLAASVLTSLRRGSSPPTCTLVEANPHRRLQQRERLERFGPIAGIRWIDPAEWEASPEKIRGCLLANEVLDAMPVHRLTFQGDAWREVYVDWERGPVEVQGPVSAPELAEELRRLGCSPREGQEVEVSREATRWIGRVASRLERGYVLLIDYGHLAPEIYGPRHHRGTLLAYHRHRTSERYLEQIGNQDLTAHVNFSAILEAARAAGLRARGPVPQGSFLLALGILERFVEGRLDWDTVRERQAVRDLFLPGGLGESHQVLVLATPDLDLDLIGLRPPEFWTPPRSGESGADPRGR